MCTTKVTESPDPIGATVPVDSAETAVLQRCGEPGIGMRNGGAEIPDPERLDRRAMEVGRRFAVRYRRAMSILSR